MTAVGLLEGLAEVTAGILKGYSGQLSDRLGKRSLFVRAGYSLSALSKPLPGLFPVISAVFVARITDRVGKGIRTAPRDALLAGYSDENRGALFGFHRGMDTLGAALGPTVALLYLHFYPGNYTDLFLLAFVPSVMAIVFTLPLKDRPVESGRREKLPYREFWQTAPVEYRRFLVLFTVFSFVNSSDVFLILKSEDVTGSSTRAILGYIFYNIIYAFASYPAGRLSDRFGKKQIFSFGLILYSMVYAGFAWTSQQTILWILFIFYGLYAASTEGIAKAWISDLVPDSRRGSAIGLLTMLSGFAILLGSLFAGILWDRFGSRVPFLFSSIVSLIVALLVLRRSPSQSLQ